MKWRWPVRAGICSIYEMTLLSSMGMAAEGLFCLTPAPESRLAGRRIWAVLPEEEALRPWLDEEHRVWYRGRICRGEHQSKHSSFRRCKCPAPNTRPLTSRAEPRCGAVPRDAAASAHRCPWSRYLRLRSGGTFPAVCCSAWGLLLKVSLMTCFWLAGASRWNQSLRPLAAGWAAEVVCPRNGWDFELSCSKSRTQLIWSFPPYPSAKSRQYLYHR